MYRIKFLNGSVKEFDSLVGANLKRANLRGVNLRGANLRGANLVGANLVRANLVRANLVGANLWKANLEGADLEGADLWGADFRGANLVGANLTYCTNIIGFYLGEHFGFMVIDSKYVRIGCEGYQLDYWLENYEEIGRDNNYRESSIKMYGVLLKLLKERIDG